MTYDTLDLPPIADPVTARPAPDLPSVDLKKIDLQTVALAQFGDWRADVAKARENLGTLALDLTIPARIAEAKTLRQRLIGTPRAEARKVAAALKSKLAAVSKAVGAEAEAAVAAYDDAETLITPQIDAAEKRIEDERIARERAEEQRIHNLKLAVDAKLDPWMDRCDADGMTAARVQAGMTALGELPMPPDLADVSAYWAERLSATRMHMERRRLFLAAQELEAAQAQARAEAQRVANIQARIAEIQAAATGHERASAADLLEARAAVAALDVSEAQYQEFTLLAQAAQAGTLAVLDKFHADAVLREAEDRRQAEARAEDERIAALAKRRQEEAAAESARIAAAAIVGNPPFSATDRAGSSEEQQPGAFSPVAQEGVAENPVQPQPSLSTFLDGDAAAVRAAVDEAAATADDSTAPGVTSEPTLTLGAINDRIAPLSISGAGMALLGFEPAGRRKAAVLFHESDWTAMRAAMVKHLQGL